MSINPADDEADARPLVRILTAEIVAAACFIAFGAVMAWNNYRIGVAWTEYGPEAGMFPFGLAVLMILLGMAALVSAFRSPKGLDASAPFITRADLPALATVVLPTILFITSIGWLGIYLPGFLLIAGFMALAGKFRWHVALATAVVVILGLFWLFEIEFRVFLPKGPIEAALGF